MIELWFSYRQARKIAEIAEKTGRAKVEILRLAVGHRKANPKKYVGLSCASIEKRRSRVSLRISKELRLDLSEEAWLDGRMPRITWIVCVILRFFACVRKDAIIRYLASGRDLRLKIEEILKCPTES